MIVVLSTVTAGEAAAREPYVAPGGVLTVSVRGFVPRTTVTERLDTSRTVRRIRADTHGRVTVRTRAPRALGRHRLIFVGRGAGVPRGPSRPPRSGPGDVQPIRVEIPRVDVVPFRVTRRAIKGVILGVDVAPHGGSGGAGVHPDADGDLATTGFDGPSQVLAAALLLLGGGLLTLAGRRNRGESVTRAAQLPPLA